MYVIRLASILLSSTTVTSLLSNLLVLAVTDTSPNRALYISDIMKMEKQTQKLLMRVIECGPVDVIVDLVWEVAGVITPRKGGGAGGGTWEDGEREREMRGLREEKEVLERCLGEQKQVNDDLAQEVSLLRVWRRPRRATRRSEGDG